VVEDVWTLLRKGCLGGSGVEIGVVSWKGNSYLLLQGMGEMHTCAVGVVGRDLEEEWKRGESGWILSVWSGEAVEVMCWGGERSGEVM
jgi:hypothetical protein